MTKALILAGGLGSRLGSLTKHIPKPLVEISGKPICLHLVDSLKKYNITQFIFAIGYKKEIFHAKFKSIFNQGTDIEYSNKFPRGLLKSNPYANCCFRLIDTGLNNQTGSRIAQVFDLIEDDQIFCTYGDGISDVNIESLIDFHNKSDNLITITAVRIPSRFGGLEIRDDKVISFSEKKPISDNWINGGFMIINREFREKYLTSSLECVLEQTPLEKAAINNDVGVFKHTGFWQCMDTPRDLEFLEKKLKSNKCI